MIFYFLIMTGICLAKDFSVAAWFAVAVAPPMLGMCVIECLANWED